MAEDGRTDAILCILPILSTICKNRVCCKF